jgi:hypothetical protein
MASTFVNNLRLEEMATGEQSGNWGTKTNTNLELIGEALGFGTEAITTNANTHTTTVADAASDAGRAIFIKYTGALDSDCTITIGPNTMKRVHIIENATTDSGSSGPYNIIISQGSGANITIANGTAKVVYLDGAGSGAAVVDAFAHLAAVDLTVDDDLIVGDDVTLKSDSAVLGFGADTDTTLTHTDGTGLTLNSTNKLTFGDAASFIQQSSDGTLRIDGEAIIDLNASTRVDVSGDIKVGGEVQTASIGFTDGDNAITIADGGGITAAAGITSTAASNTLGATSFNDANITNVGSIALDSISSDAGTGTAITFGASTVPNTQTAGSQTGNITPDFSQYTNFILTLTGNIVLQDPGDEVAGQMGVFVFVQDGTGGRTLSHADDRYHVAGGTSLTLSTGANDVDVVPYFVKADGTILLGAIQKDFVEA